VSRLRVLLVEDEAPKRAHIQRLLATLSADVDVIVARSVNSALDEIEAHLPDLLLLDMSLPTFDIAERESGGRPQGFGGIEILRHMKLAEMTCPTIVITGYEAFLREAGKAVELTELRAELAKEFPAYLRGVLHYNSTYDEWKNELARVLADVGVQLRSDQ